MSDDGMSEKGLRRLYSAHRAIWDGRRLFIRIDQCGWYGLAWSETETWAIMPEPFYTKEFVSAIALTFNHTLDLLHEVARKRHIVLDVETPRA